MPLHLHDGIVSFGQGLVYCIGAYASGLLATKGGITGAAVSGDRALRARLELIAGPDVASLQAVGPRWLWAEIRGVVAGTGRS